MYEKNTQKCSTSKYVFQITKLGLLSSNIIGSYVKISKVNEVIINEIHTEWNFQKVNGNILKNISLK